MKLSIPRTVVFAVLFLAASFQLRAQPVQPNLMRLPQVIDQVTLTTNTASLSSDITPQSVLTAMQRVGDWQLAHEATNRPTGWIQAVGDVGMMALAGISGDPKYRDSMLAKGEANGWVLPQYQGRKYHADDQCYGQVCAELYFLYRENRMIAPMREHFDWILEHPSAQKDLQNSSGQELWSWCDALFMALPSWLRLYTATDDTRYLDFAVTNFWRTADYLYDKDAHLFYRDSRFFTQTESNGAKIFWSRGNGWVLAGIVRMLQYLPMNSPERPRFEQLFKDMSAKILSLQQPDGMWRASLLDPEDFPMPEASGSAMFTYGLAWGVNQGLLDRATYEPAVRKAWPALVGCVDADGKLTHIQPAGDHPVKFAADSTQPYGGGVFLLAGSEVYRMAVYGHVHPIAIKVTNSGSFHRNCETVETMPPTSKFVWGQAEADLFKGKTWDVMDGISSRILDSQVYASETNQPPNKILFQVDLAPGETRTFYILDASALAAVPPPIVKTYARQVTERFNDMAWESDRDAHRMYQLDLIKGEGTISSGIDVWSKRTRGLVVDKWYKNADYHNDHGEGMDDYRVGRSRGGGGLGIWNGTNLFVSINYRDARVITTGPIRSEFELTYDAWDAGGRKIFETKRISIDAGSNMSRAESIFSSDPANAGPLQIGVGIAERPVNINESAVPKFTQNRKENWMTYWQPLTVTVATSLSELFCPAASRNLSPKILFCLCLLRLI